MVSTITNVTHSAKHVRAQRSFEVTPQKEIDRSGTRSDMRSDMRLKIMKSINYIERS